jgi:hypothetical protein
MTELRHNQPSDRWEEEMQEAMKAFPYPPTPDLAGQVRQRLTVENQPKLRSNRRMSWAMAAVLTLIILGSLFAVPQVRAAVVEVLRIGAVRIFLIEPTSTPTTTATTTSTPEPTVTSNQNAALPSTVTTEPTATRTPRSFPTPRPSPTPLYSILDLTGETTLAEAKAKVDFTVRLPTYPADLGEPDRVFLQNMNGAVLVLVWLAPDQPDQVWLSLDQLESNVMAMKMAPEIVETITINGQPAYWVEGAHLLVLRNGNYDLVRAVGSNVLIWEEDGITYRLETNLSKVEGARIAESLE